MCVHPDALAGNFAPSDAQLAGVWVVEQGAVAHVTLILVRRDVRNKYLWLPHGQDPCAGVLRAVK